MYDSSHFFDAAAVLCLRNTVNLANTVTHAPSFCQMKTMILSQGAGDLSETQS